MPHRDYSTGIKNCHYVVKGTAIEVKKLPGAVRLSMKPSAADRNIKVRSGSTIYQTTTARQGTQRQAELEIVSLPESFLIDVLGWTKGTDGSLTEGIQPNVHIILLYETENGGCPVRHMLYDCVVSSPSFDATTISSDLSIDKRKLDIVFNPDPSNNNNLSRQIARADNENLFNSWFGLKT